MESERGAGGTSGGIENFLFGVGMAVVGAYLLTNQVTVTSGFWHWGGMNAFGLSLRAVHRRRGNAVLQRALHRGMDPHLRRRLPVDLSPGSWRTWRSTSGRSTLYNTILMLVLLAGAWT